MIAARARPSVPNPPYLVAGLGRAGTSALTGLFQRIGPSALVAWDGAAVPRNGAAIEEFRRCGVRIELGTDGLALLGCDPRPRTVVVSPGLPDDLPLLRAAREHGLTVLDEAELGWRQDARPWVGVTGTNGKSTSSRLVVDMLRANGAAPVLGGNTHAAPPLSSLGPDGDVVVAEISSFQLERTQHLVADAALLTQIGSDHLDRHGTQAAYAAVKERLFVREDAHVPVAAVSADDGFSRSLAERLQGRGGEVVTFGKFPEADVRVIGLDWDLDGNVIQLDVQGALHTQQTRLPGPHNAANVAGALALACALGLDLGRTADAIATTLPPPGRMMRVTEDGASAPDVLVDFAKNADGVRAALATVRRVARQRGTRVVAVVSAMPVVDPGGLFAMGAAAAVGADRLIVTVDRWDAHIAPQPPPGLLRGVRSAGGRAEITNDRRRAFVRALDIAGSGDVVIVLGRTPTPMPSVGPDGSVELFEDAVELRKLLRR